MGIHIHADSKMTLMHLADVFIQCELQRILTVISKELALCSLAIKIATQEITFNY